MTGYRFNTAPELRVGLGAARELGAYCAQLGVKRPLLVTDPGLVAVGLAAPVQEAMAAQCEHVALFSEVTADPAESVVLDALSALQAGQADGVVGLGGGSSMDVAKAIAVLAAGTQSLAGGKRHTTKNTHLSIQWTGVSLCAMHHCKKNIWKI